MLKDLRTPWCQLDASFNARLESDVHYNQQFSEKNLKLDACLLDRVSGSFVVLASFAETKGTKSKNQTDGPAIIEL